MGRYAICKGSYALERQIAPLPVGDDATSGTRIHAWLEGDLITLTEDEQATADACAIQEGLLVHQVFGVSMETLKPRREVRIWNGPKQEWSGKADAVYVVGDHALIIDYKTGRGEVEPAVGNMQLRALAVLLKSDQPGIRIIDVAVIQPLVARDPLVCRYEGADLDRAAAEVNAIMRDIHLPDAPRVTSEAGCKYCRAKSICPEAQGQVQALTTVPETALAPVELARLLDACKVAESVIDEIRARAKAELTAGREVPGWRLRPTGIRQQITDPTTVFGRFVAAGGTEKQFLDTITVAKGALKTALKEVTGAKGKALDDRMDALLEGCTEETPASMTLAREAAR